MTFVPAAITVLACMTGGAPRGIVYEIYDKGVWAAAVGEFSTVDFVGFPEDTYIVEQYAELGVVFTDGDDSVYHNNSFPNDGVGLDGNGDITVVFAQAQSWIGVEFPGFLRLRLYRDGKLAFISNDAGAGFTDNFLGLLSEEPFDSAVLVDPAGEAEIDDLHFGPPPCLADLDGDGEVGVVDFLGLLTAWGSNPDGPPDVDYDGVVGPADFAALLDHWGACPGLVDCNGNGVYDLVDLAQGAGEDCNANAILDGCDLASGTSPDYDGSGVPDECEPPPNDACEDALPIGDGATPFLTFGASRSQPPANCPFLIWFENDVWFRYVPTCTGTATFSVCNGASFDTAVAVYYDLGCKLPFTPLACSDDAPGCGQTSETQALVVQGFPYLVRVGGTTGGGVGELTVSCEPLP